jgi:hypothetical protein
MTDRDKAYLIAHNKRRIEWHARYNKAYVPLKWSKGEYMSLFVRNFFLRTSSYPPPSALGLRDLSKEYAIKLLDTCRTGLPEHETNQPYGENLARNKGSGLWGQLYSKSFARSFNLDPPYCKHSTNHSCCKVPTKLWVDL